MNLSPITLPPYRVSSDPAYQNVTTGLALGNWLSHSWSSRLTRQNLELPVLYTPGAYLALFCVSEASGLPSYAQTTFAEAPLGFGTPGTLLRTPRFLAWDASTASVIDTAVAGLSSFLDNARVGRGRLDWPGRRLFCYGVPADSLAFVTAEDGISHFTTTFDSTKFVGGEFLFFGSLTSEYTPSFFTDDGSGVFYLDQTIQLDTTINHDIGQLSQFFARFERFKGVLYHPDIFPPPSPNFPDLDTAEDNVNTNYSSMNSMLSPYNVTIKLQAATLADVQSEIQSFFS